MQSCHCDNIASTGETYSLKLQRDPDLCILRRAPEPIAVLDCGRYECPDGLGSRRTSRDIGSRAADGAEKCPMLVLVTSTIDTGSADVFRNACFTPPGTSNTSPAR
jgi:hypothetical protein